MSKPQDRTVYKTQSGDWANKRNDASRASSLHSTQAEAVQSAKTMLKNQGGGEVTISSRDNKFRAKDTVSPGKDPYPPKG